MKKSYKKFFTNIKENNKLDFWKMTKNEYKLYRKKELDKYKVSTPKGIKDFKGIADNSEYLRQKYYFQDWKLDHEDEIDIALSNNKDVPEKVLKEYPKLKKKYNL